MATDQAVDTRDQLVADALDLFTLSVSRTSYPEHTRKALDSWYAELTAKEVLISLRALGCALYMDGDILRVRDPQKVLTDRLRQAIRTHKPELVWLIGPGAANDTQTANTAA